jgi:hypothetical protein
MANKVYAKTVSGKRNYRGADGEQMKDGAYAIFVDGEPAYNVKELVQIAKLKTATDGRAPNAKRVCSAFKGYGQAAKAILDVFAPGAKNGIKGYTIQNEGKVREAAAEYAAAAAARREAAAKKKAEKAAADKAAAEKVLAEAKAAAEAEAAEAAAAEALAPAA